MSSYKIKNISQLEKIIRNSKKSGKRIVFTNGCFDILHAGHIRYLQKAAQKGDLLMVAVNSDSSVRQIKEKGRPITPQADRAAIVAALECVDYVTIFAETTPLKIIKRLRPHVLVKGGDWKLTQIVGKGLVESHGGKVLTVPYTKGRSTKSFISKIVKTFGPQK